MLRSELTDLSEHRKVMSIALRGQLPEPSIPSQLDITRKSCSFWFRKIPTRISNPENHPCFRFSNIRSNGFSFQLEQSKVAKKPGPTFSWHHQGMYCGLPFHCGLPFRCAFPTSPFIILLNPAQYWAMNVSNSVPNYLILDTNEKDSKVSPLSMIFSAGF